MRYLLAIMLLSIGISCRAESEPEAVFREAIPGCYVRGEGGIASLRLNLNKGGVYVFQLVGDMGVIETKRGAWRIKDDEVVLSGPCINLLSRFRVYSSAQVKGLSLLPLGDDEWRKNDDDESRLFIREKR